MAPPIDHWVFNLPNQDQMRTVAISVTALDGNGQPVAAAGVVAYCEPWDFVVRAQTDNLGKSVVRGPVGDWTFIAARGQRNGTGFLAAQSKVRVERDLAVVVQSQKSVTIRTVSAGDSAKQTTPPRPGKKAKQPPKKRTKGGTVGELTFVPTTLPGPVDGMTCGFVRNGACQMLVSPGVTGHVWLNAVPDGNRPGCIMLGDLAVDAPVALNLDESKMGRLELTFDGYAAGEARVVVRFDPISAEGGTLRVPIQVPATGGRFVFAVSPGQYRVNISPHVGKGAGTYVPNIVTFTAGETVALQYGGRFSAKAYVRSWVPKQLRLWFDVMDDRGNYLLHTGGSPETHLTLVQGGETVFDGAVQRSEGRWIDIERSWGPKPKMKPLEFEYRISSKLLGSVKIAGTMEPGASLRDQLPKIYSSANFDVYSRDNKPEAAKRATDALEAAFAWLSQHYAGEVNLRRNDSFRLNFILPVGVGASGGDVFAVQIYGAYSMAPSLLEGGTRVLFHEFGHSYQALPPHHQARGMGSATCESQATQVGDYCLRAVFGERAYRWTNQTTNARFFEALASGDKTSEAPNRYQFVLHYVDSRYGQRVNAEFFRAMYGSQGNCEQILLSAGFLQTEAERAAALYSFLAGENLAWLYRWAGFDVSDVKMEQALQHFRAQGAKRP